MAASIHAVSFIGDEFAGIDSFPFASTELSLLAVNHRVLELAEALLDDDDIHIYGAEGWAKYTGACDYDQDMHRDYLNHTILVPSTTPGCRQVEMFVFLNDVPEELGPPHLVSRRHTANLPAVPNWFLRQGKESGSRFDDGSGSRLPATNTSLLDAGGTGRHGPALPETRPDTLAYREPAIRTAALAGSVAGLRDERRLARTRPGNRRYQRSVTSSPLRRSTIATVTSPFIGRRKTKSSRRS
jgi:hypothetical protein